MKKIYIPILTVALLMSAFLLQPWSLVARADYCTEIGGHRFAAHYNTGAGYSTPAGTHKHEIDNPNGTTVYVDCTKTQYFNYCYLKCVYCGTALPDQVAHTHSYIRHSANGSTETIN